MTEDEIVDPLTQLDSIEKLQAHFQEEYLCEANLRHFTKGEQKIL